MTFMHMDSTSAASAVGNIVGFDWEDSPPYSNIALFDDGDGFNADVEFIMYGQGSIAPGTYRGEEHGFEQFDEDWINPAFVGNVDDYFFRTIDITSVSNGTYPGTGVAYSGVWTDKRTDWRCFASVAPHTNMSVDTTAQWYCYAVGFQGDSYFEQDLDCVVEIGRAGTGITATFEFTQVDLGNDEFVITDHGFETGDQVIYTQGGGSPPSPLIDQAMYSVRRVSSSRFSIGNNLISVDATPVLINLTFSGTGTGHTFTRIDALASVNLDMGTNI